ncbi:MAG: glycogen debranching enzyme GlgX [Caulobacteraceae bacterium]|nr:glycogen debranching enzyme GlgX [Caulobacteraceae bacterium]
MVVTGGAPEPLGVSLTASGINVAVWSARAEAVELCLFDEAGERETARILLTGRTGPVFHGHVEGVGEGARYGLRAHGPFAPERGHRFNPHKLLVDPYALALDRPFSLHPAMFAYRRDDPRGGASFEDEDSAPVMPKAVVTRAVEPPSAAPFLPWGETVVYELHVRGFTRAHPDVPEAVRGTFAGLAHPAAIAHLKRLGVTTVELMPCAAWIDERHLPPLGLANAWGYNPVALLVPDPRLAPGGWVEVREAIATLGAAGIETVIDVVLNHTGEGDELGPTLSLRGLDNAAYYRVAPDDPSAYRNDAGTGSTLDLNGSPGLRLAMDALRAWRRLGGVAGFRFDLATTMGRTAGGFDPAAPLLAAIAQDPDLRALKLIAEPWDVGPGGYQLGRFPPPWGEWNDRFRDTARGFWRGDAVPLGELSRRLAGSEDLFAGRRPSRSVNFVVSHDGFTLADLVAFRFRHNEANGEENRDGTDHNLSWNHGVEGPSDDPAVTAARLSDQRALLATLLLARGTPMLTMGAELGRTQGGNNNAYAQDGSIGWADADQALIDFAARLVAIRRDHPALRADRFLTGAPVGGTPYLDVAWRTAKAGPLSEGDWNDPAGETLVMILAEPVGDGLDRVIVAVHRGAEHADVALPENRDGFAWRLLADSADPARGGEAELGTLSVSPRSVVVLAETAAASRPRRRVADAVLARLASAAGIAPHWSSLDGVRHAVGRDTQTALLDAMGLPAASTHQALQSLHALADDHDRRSLPFALTGRVDQPLGVRLVVDERAPPPRTWLTIHREGEAGDDGGLRLPATPAAGWESTFHALDGRIVRALELPLPALDPGVYTLRREDRPDLACRLIIAPAACHTPEALRGDRRLWGVTAQIYSVRRVGDQSVGDFTTLGALAEAAAARGAAVLGINPLHALFIGDRERVSPYYPSDRRFLDPLYLDLEQVPGVTAFREDARALAGLSVVDYPRVWAVKVAALESAFAGAPSDQAFEAFIVAGGERLRRFCLFQAIAEVRPGEPWRRWPEGLRDPDGPDVRAFAAAYAPRLRFHAWLQWHCEDELAGAARRASGLALGLCRDLAVGAAPDGAELWDQAALVAEGASIGAPPDPFGPRGQVWGLPPFDPRRLRQDGYRAMSELFAANMRHAGALRIDHVMGLARQFWVPEGASGADGAYVDFPLDDLLAVLAVESERAKCLVIGEDLGSVPEGFRERLWAVGALSYRVLPFERDGAGFTPPGAWPRPAMACVATHDLPPLAGWWAGVDIAERLDLGLVTPDGAETARADRADDRRGLVAALAREGLAPPAAEPDGPLTPALAAAIHAFIAASTAAIAVAQVEDLAGERTAVNLPGTDRERPNWRRRIAPPLETLFETPLAQAIVGAMRAGRSGRP